MTKILNRKKVIIVKLILIPTGSFSPNCGVKPNPTNRGGTKIQLDIFSELSVKYQVVNYAVFTAISKQQVTNNSEYPNVFR